MNISTKIHVYIIGLVRTLVVNYNCIMNLVCTTKSLKFHTNPEPNDESLCTRNFSKMP